MPDYDSDTAALLVGDCVARLREVQDGFVRCCVTSPPYFGLRDYGVDGQIGVESDVDEYVSRLVAVFREVHRVLAEDGTLWLNLGDSYVTRWGSTRAEGRAGLEDNRRTRSGKVPTGYKEKDLFGIPWAVAFALRADGWWLRQEIIWHKPNPMPEPVKDRCTKAHEHVFLLAKSQDYFFNAEAIREESEDRPLSSWEDRKKSEPVRRGDPGVSGHVTHTHTLASRPGRNKRDVWTIAPKPFKGAHFAVFPPALVEPCVLAGSAPGDVVLDPFTGSGTTGMVALQHGRNFIGTELNPDYAVMAWNRITGKTA